MGLWEKFKNLTKADDFDDDYDQYEDDEEESVEEKIPIRSSRRTPPPSPSSVGSGNKVLNINTTTQLQVVLVKPSKFEDASDIADHLKDMRTVVLNLESTSKDIARRLLDFLSGVAYANQGKIKRVANNTYIITPYNVGIQGDLIDELENNGMYF